MSDLFKAAADLSGYLFRITDNGGETCDRITVLFSDGNYLALSGNPNDPQGFSQWGEGLDPSYLAERVESGGEVDLAFADLPAKIQGHILSRLNEAFGDFLERLEAVGVSERRADAFTNDGLPGCAGVGIWTNPTTAAARYWIKLDADSSDDDRGPYPTIREALLATLPDQHGFAGPEYHSPIGDVATAPASPERAAALAALEARVSAAYEAERWPDRQLFVATYRDAIEAMRESRE